MKRPRHSLLRYWRPHFGALLRHFTDRGDSRWIACKKLAPLLSRTVKHSPSWTPEYLVQVLSRGIEPSHRFKIAVEKLRLDKSKNKLRVRSDRPRLYVPFASRADIDYIERLLSPDDRRDVLLAAASHEDL